MILVGKKAPFNALAVLGNGEIVDSYDFAKAIQGKYTVVVLYPLDFTFVCPSELIVLDKRTAKLKELGVGYLLCIN